MLYPAESPVCANGGSDNYCMCFRMAAEHTNESTNACVHWPVMIQEKHYFKNCSEKICTGNDLSLPHIMNRLPLL